MEDEVVGPLGWQSFSVDQMRNQRAQQGTDFVEVMAEPSFRMGLLNAPVGDSMAPTTHDDNVIYHVVAGTAQLSVGGADFSVEAGSTFFVRREVEHRFHSVTSDLDAVVVFAQLPSAVGDPEVVAFAMEDMVAARDRQGTVYTPLLDTSTMTLGMYLLPKGGGDNAHAHAFDELKIVVTGGGRLDIGPGGTEVGPGSIVFIEDTLEHRFRRVSDDLAVLLIWAP